MKNLKKMVVWVLALIMVFSMMGTAFAEETKSYTIKLIGTDESPTAGHTYTVYQIFTGDVNEEEAGDRLSNVKYGVNYTPGTVNAGDAVPQEELDNITNAQTWAEELMSNNRAALEGTYGVLNEENGWSLDVSGGYYLIVDETDPLPEGHNRSAYIVEVAADVEMAPKSGVITFEKKVKDINDSEDASIDDNAWTDTADHDIGDVIPYKLTSTITGLEDFETYPVKIVDTMSKGLTYNNDAVITVKVNGSTTEEDVTAKFTITSADYTGTDAKYVDGKVWTFECDDIKSVLQDVNMQSVVITIEYTCTLNENAVIGEAGNPNKALEYYREPDSDEWHTTPEDVNIVFTFKTEVNKVDENEKPLTGAEFTLEKFVTKEDGSGEWVAIDVVKNDDGTVFTFKGLDDGKYRITETVTPAGYNSIDPIYFTVTAEHTVDPANLELKSLNATAVKQDGTDYTDAEKASGNIAAFEVVKVDDKIDKISTTVVNKPGSLLPETGGIGTTIFYVAGSVLVLSAVVLLVTKKRMSHRA